MAKKYTMRLNDNCSGMTLVEVILVVIIAGILATVALRSTAVMTDTARTEETKQEMDALAFAVIGNAELHNNGIRSDFGYVGDVGAMPTSLDDLFQNPGGYSTWNGPYVKRRFDQMTDDYKKDAWDTPYSYSGGVNITSTGSGSSIVRKLGNSVSDFTINQVSGVVLDLDGTPPGTDYKDSVCLRLTVPDGSGSTVARPAGVDVGGFFTFDSIPIGNHDIDVIYLPDNDTLRRFVSVLPKSTIYATYYLAGNHWQGGSSGGGCAGSGSVTLKPEGVGSTTHLTPVGCTANWECVAGSAGYVRCSGTNFLRDEYQTEDPVDTSCTITSVTVYFVARRMGTPASGGAILRTHSTLYRPATENLANSFTTYGHQWTTNPNTGGNWTWTEVIGMEIGVRLKRNSPGGNNPRCKEVWAVVEYSN